METKILNFLTSLAGQPNYSESTRAAYASDLRIFLDHLTGMLQRPPTIQDLNGGYVLSFLEYEQKEGRQLSTLLRRRASLQRFEKYLVSEGLLNKGQFEDGSLQISQLLSAAPSKEAPYCLPSDTVSQLFSILEDSTRPLTRRDRAILGLLLEMGLSVSTMIRINLNDLDLRVGKIHLIGHGGEDYWLPLGAAANPLECYIQNGRPELNPSADEPALFVSQNGVRMSRQSVWQILRHWGKLAGLEVPLSPRILRHTAALRMANSGRPLSEIQILLGHTNPLSTHALLNRLEAAQISK